MRLPKRVGITIIAAVASSVFLSALVLSNVSPVIRFAFGRSDSMLLTIKTRQYAIRMEGSVEVTLALRNLGMEEVGLSYHDRHMMDLFLYSLDGRLVTYFAKDRVFAQVLSSIRLQPGESKEWRLSWDTFDETGVTVPGLYLLEGSVLYFGTSRLPILILP